MNLFALVAGVLVALLGGLWLVQGLGLVQIDPIACVGECEPLEGPSPTWAIIGGAMLAVGVAAILYGVRGRKRP